jgi:hypothetical protein
MFKFSRLYISFFCALIYTSANAQKIEDKAADSIITQISNSLKDGYPFVDISAKYAAALKQKMTAGRYHNLTEDEFAKKVTEDLQAVHSDRHLHVYKRATPAQSTGPVVSWEASLKEGNYGFQGVNLDKITSTAYVNVPGPMYPVPETFEMAASAMTMAAYSKYVIIDLRENPGGSGQICRFLASYFYNAGDEKYYLYGFHKDKTQDEQEWTYAYVPGKRNPDAKLYILTGRHTGSAAEGMAYGMQKLGRAVIVGDTTAGAGIAGSDIELKGSLHMFLPVKMIVQPHSTVGWEGTGVYPDVSTGKEDALLKTKELILKDILSNDDSDKRKQAAQWLLDNYTVSSGNHYEAFPGKYNDDVTITKTDSGFVLNRAARALVLKELKQDVFGIIGFQPELTPNTYRVMIHRNEHAEIDGVTIVGLMTDGSMRTLGYYQKK